MLETTGISFFLSFLSPFLHPWCPSSVPNVILSLLPSIFVLTLFLSLRPSVSCWTKWLFKGLHLFTFLLLLVHLGLLSQPMSLQLFPCLADSASCLLVCFLGLLSVPEGGGNTCTRNSTRLHNVTSQKTVHFIVTTVRPSYLTYLNGPNVECNIKCDFMCEVILHLFIRC